MDPTIRWKNWVKSTNNSAMDTLERGKEGGKMEIYNRSGKKGKQNLIPGHYAMMPYTREQWETQTKIYSKSCNQWKRQQRENLNTPLWDGQALAVSTPSISGGLLAYAFSAVHRKAPEGLMGLWGCLGKTSGFRHPALMLIKGVGGGLTSGTQFLLPALPNAPSSNWSVAVGRRSRNSRVEGGGGLLWRAFCLVILWLKIIFVYLVCLTCVL